MKNLLILLLIITCLSSCLTHKRFSKDYKIAIEKGWVDTTTKVGSAILIYKHDTVSENKISEEGAKSITQQITDIFNSDTNNLVAKNGKSDSNITSRVAFSPSFKKKVEKVIDEEIKDSIIPKVEKHCLVDTFKVSNTEIYYAIWQDTLTGEFKTNYKVRETIVNLTDKNWFDTYIKDVWFLYLIIGILLLVIFIKK